jgi:DNA invertase Pin-like site-specific DNA recombinase
MAFSMAAEIERALISQRTKKALRFKKAQGLKLGRPTGPGKVNSIRNRPETGQPSQLGSKKHGLKLSKAGTVA